MTRLDRYLLSEMVLPFFSGILLIVVMLVGNTIFPLIQTIVQNNIPFMAVARLVVYNIPPLVILTLPAAMALSAAWAVNRLARDYEITAIRMSGVPIRRIFLPIFIVGAIVSLTSFFIGDRVAPRAQHEFNQTQAQMLAYAFQAQPSLAENKVFTYKNHSFHIREIRKDPSGKKNKLLLSGITIIERPANGGYPMVVTAPSALYDNEIITLNNAVVHTFDANGYVVLESVAPSFVLNLRVPLSGLAENAFMRPEEQTMEELGKQMQALRKMGQDDTIITYNYHTKLALPFVCFAFALCAPPLSLKFARAGAYMGIFLSLVLVWVGWNTLFVSKMLGLSGKVNPMLAAWSPDILFLILGIWFLWRVE